VWSRNAPEAENMTQHGVGDELDYRGQTCFGRKLPTRQATVRGWLAGWLDLSLPLGWCYSR
jgi:hypothetical protein